MYSLVYAVLLLKIFKDITYVSCNLFSSLLKYINKILEELFALLKYPNYSPPSNLEWFIIAQDNLQSSVQLLSHVWHLATPWTTACHVSLSITNSWSLPKLMSIKSLMPSNHLILYNPLLLPTSIFPSIRVFSNEWPKYWSFTFNTSPFNKYSGLISFRMDWLDLLAV